MHASKKGFHYFKKIRHPLFCGKRLIKQILTPALISVPYEPHQLPRGMQRKRPGPPRQFEPGLLWRTVAFAVIATVTARHQVFPRGTPAPRSRHNMVQRQFRTRKDPSAELAGIPVSQQNVFPRKRTALLWNVPVGQQTNHRWHFVRMCRRVHLRAVHLLSLRHALQQQNHRPANSRNIDRFVRRIQYEHRLLHQRCTPR